VSRVIEHAPDPDVARPLVFALVPNARYQKHAARLLDAWNEQAGVPGPVVAMGVRTAARAAKDEREVQRRQGEECIAALYRSMDPLFSGLRGP